MLEIDVLSGRHSTIPLVVPNRVDQPAVMLPERFAARKPEIVVAEDLSALPFALDALTQEKRSLYTAVPLDEVPTIIHHIEEVAATTSKPVTEQIPELSDQQENLDHTQSDIQITSNGLVLMYGMDLQDLEDAERKKMRQLQRLNQFKRIVETIDDGVSDLHKDLSSEQVEKIHRLLPTFRRVAAWLYADELSQDPFTREAVQEFNKSRLPQAGPVFAAVEEILQGDPPPPVFKQKEINAGDLEKHKNTKIKNKLKNLPKRLQRLVKNFDKGLLIAWLKQKTRKEDSSQKSAEIPEENRQWVDNYVAKVKSDEVQKTGVLYVHDAKLDEPSSDAAEFVRELWERPF